MRDYDINVCSLSGLHPNKIPDNICPIWDSETMCSSLAAETGCDVRSGAILDTTSMSAFVGVSKYHFENIVCTEPEFSFVYRKGRFMITYPNSLQAGWGEYQERIQVERQTRAENNLMHWSSSNMTDVTSHSI